MISFNFYFHLNPNWIFSTRENLFIIIRFIASRYLIKNVLSVIVLIHTYKINNYYL